MEKMQLCLWFDGNAADAVDFYRGVFKDFKEHSRMHVGPGLPMTEGSVLTVDFSVNGMRLLALNAGPQFTFNEAASLMVMCETQAEIDYYWDKLAEGGGKHVECGWLKDKFGLSWQVCPIQFREWTRGTPEQTARLMAAVMTMTKLDMAKMDAAFNG